MITRVSTQNDWLSFPPTFFLVIVIFFLIFILQQRQIYTNILLVNSMTLYNVLLQGSRMATRRLPATPILLFQITVNHKTYIVYIHDTLVCNVLLFF